MTLLLKNCRLTDGTSADIKIEGHLVSAIENNINAGEGDQVFDAGGNLVAPGFIDCHTHLDKSLLLQNTTTECISLGEAIFLMRKLKKKFTLQDVKDRARNVLNKAIANGTVMIRSHTDIDPSVGLISMKALLELREEYWDKIRIQLVAFPQEGINMAPGTLKILEEALAMGADAIGGIPNIDPDPQKHIQQVFTLAQKYGVPVDMHIDESEETSNFTIEMTAREALKRDMTGQITAAHCCALDNLEPAHLERVMNLIREAGINIISLPSTNLYLQGRNCLNRVWRGLAPVKKLLKHGITVAFASDNIQDLFNPFGNANLLQTGYLAAHACQMGSRTELRQVFNMISTEPAKILGTTAGIAPGLEANMVILPVRTVEEAIVEQPRILARIFSGNITVLSDPFFKKS